MSHRHSSRYHYQEQGYNPYFHGPPPPMPYSYGGPYYHHYFPPLPPVPQCLQCAVAAYHPHDTPLPPAYHAPSHHTPAHNPAFIPGSFPFRSSSAATTRTYPVEPIDIPPGYIRIHCYQTVRAPWLMDAGVPLDYQVHDMHLDMKFGKALVAMGATEEDLKRWRASLMVKEGGKWKRVETFMADHGDIVNKNLRALDWGKGKEGQTGEGAVVNMWMERY